MRRKLFQRRVLDVLASDLEALRAKLGQDDPEVIAAFTKIGARLTALGADEQNPIPPTP